MFCFDWSTIFPVHQYHEHWKRSGSVSSRCQVCLLTPLYELLDHNRRVGRKLARKWDKKPGCTISTHIQALIYKNWTSDQEKNFLLFLTGAQTHISHCSQWYGGESKDAFPLVMQQLKGGWHPDQPLFWELHEFCWFPQCCMLRSWLGVSFIFPDCPKPAV